MLQQSSLLNNMGFSSKSVFQCHQYSINIAELISPIYHLVVELCEHNDRAVKFHQWAHNLFDVKKVIGVSTLPESNHSVWMLHRIWRMSYTCLLMSWLIQESQCYTGMKGKYL